MTKQVERFCAAERRLWRSFGVEPRERFVTLRSGPRVRVLEHGDGPPLLFIHGATNGASSWVNLVAQLDDFRCITVDRPGCGLSSPINDGRPLAAFADAQRYAEGLVRDVLDALDLERANVIATSYGGFFALRGAAAYPDRIHHLVEFSWPLGAPIARVPTSMRTAAIPGIGRLMESMPVTRSATRLLLRQIGLRGAIERGDFTDEMLDWFVALLRDTDTLTNERRASPRMVTPLRGFNDNVLFDDRLLAQVHAPVSLIWGADDPNGGATIAREFAARLPNAELHLLDDAGHAPWIDDVDRCALLVRHFLTDAASG
jgi:2-hydroxy-6-oxonona-2,4-dienedioate hydrolase